ncbi:hypothetical protein BDR26DRAFT_1008918 [Obelidium mucronatum]|nr:hypothetical protein BDR26DRAFT_1008918 [Obelidium mucronatum]
MLSPNEVRERKALITKRTSFQFTNSTHTIEASAMNWIFGDFLLVKHPRLKKVLSVVKAANAAMCFMKLLPKHVHLTASRLDWFCDFTEEERLSKNLMQELAKDVRNAKEFLEEVFGNPNIWNNIVKFCASIEDVFDLVVATGKAVKASDEEIETHKKRLDEETFNEWILYGYRKAWNIKNQGLTTLSPPSNQEILSLLHEPIFAPLLENLKKHPAYLKNPRHSWTNVIFEYNQSSQKSTVGRRCDLRDALQSQNLNLRNDSKFCNQYIAGSTVCAELSQVVATCKLTATLFAYGHSTWSHFRQEKEDRMLELVLDGGKGWVEAVNEIVSSQAFINECVKWSSYVVKKRRVAEGDRVERRQRPLVE